ncbi:MAG: hypothetical protein K2X94_03775 [Amoebophilaceae bacterium]|nr:hypothetical protein [Amoebophilaceae bacterium]
MTTLSRATQLLALLLLLNHDSCGGQSPGDTTNCGEHLPEGISALSRSGRLAQINTGEGKSLIVAILAAIHGLQGKKVDVVTTSTQLSIPEVKKQSPFFELLGLTAAEKFMCRSGTRILTYI